MKASEEQEIPVFIVTETVLFPGMTAQVNCYEDDPERRLIEENYVHGREIGVFLADSSTWGTDDPRPLPVGCKARILDWEDISPMDRLARVQGISRLQIVDWVSSNPYPKAIVQEAEPSRGILGKPVDPKQTQRIRAGLQELCFLQGGEEYTRLIPLLDVQKEPGRLADFAAFHLVRDIFLKQELLETLAPADRLDTISHWLNGEMGRHSPRPSGP